MTQRPSSPLLSSKKPAPRRPTGVALLSGVSLLLGLSAVLAGCPIYDADSCAADPKCNPVDSGYPTDDTGTVDTGTDSGCGAACPVGYTCNNVGAGEFKCQAYDCRAAEKACKAPMTCTELSAGVWSCSNPLPDDCTKTGCITGYTCKDVGGSKRCESTDPNACVADGDCTAKTGAGSLCLGGVCKAPKDLCSDSTQCATGTCVDGRCASKCSATCATGYTCDDKTSACTGGTGACSVDKACASGSTCVAGRCVAPAATNGACPTGQVSVAGGCVVDDRPAFFCDKDGTKDGEQDVCAAGSICLHHNCYRACTGSTDCATLKDFPVCKDVTTTAGTPKKVCGTAGSFGTECDLSAATPKPCTAGKVCLDGKCI